MINGLHPMNTKDKLLINLKKSSGIWISGEALSKKLSVSRAAISKHIRALKEQGYDIESATKKGYLLKKISDRVLESEIVDGLETKVFGKKKIVYFQETDSTNTQAKILAEQGAPEGTVVIAEKQTKGRGRKGRSWLSPDGDGIYMSVILRPDIPPFEAPRITLLTAVALAEALISQVQLELRIKWPNDILIHGKKIAGILTEISSEMDVIDYIVVGLGLNVNTLPDKFTEDLKKQSTSVLIETGEPFSRVKLVQAFLHWFERYYDILTTRGFTSIIKRWRELADIIGKEIRVDGIGKTYTGKVLTVDDDGVLILKDKHGQTHRIISGDVTLT